MGFGRPPAFSRDPLRYGASRAAPSRAAGPSRPRHGAVRGARPGQAKRPGVESVSEPLGEALARIVGPRWVRSRPAELRTFEADGLPTHAARPRLVVLPGTRSEVIEVVRLLYREKTAWVARGAGTGLSGGALASD